MRTDLPATLFWLGNDLMWIKHRIDQNAPVDLILVGVESSRQYLMDLEADNIVIAFIDMARKDIENQAFGFALRDIDSIKRYIHLELTKAQPNFKKLGLRRDNGLN